MRHAITRLAEERRILRDVYSAVSADRGMPADERRAMLIQTTNEIKEVDEGLRLLRRFNGFPIPDAPEIHAKRLAETTPDRGEVSA